MSRIISLVLLVIVLSSCERATYTDTCLVISSEVKEQALDNFLGFIKKHDAKVYSEHPLYIEVNKQEKFKLILISFSEDLSIMLFRTDAIENMKEEVESIVSKSYKSDKVKSCKEAGFKNTFATGEI